MNNNISNHKNKIVVFDLDETLGSFVELGMFWDALENFYGHKLSNNEFINFLDIFIEYLRPDIINILKFIINKRNNGECYKIMIYTNNQAPKSWCSLICSYFDKKLNTKVFDKIISAFKVNGKIVEICRKTHNKTIGDLINCSKIPEDTKICFIDDQEHPYMKNENVYYIKIKPYNYSLPYNIMANKYYYHNYASINNVSNKDEFVNTITKIMNHYDYEHKNKHKNEIEIDKIISKQIMKYLNEFFYVRKNKTIKKNKKNNNTKTIKNKN